MAIRETSSARQRDRRGYTLAELMLLVALAAILVAIFVDIRRRFSSGVPSIMSISLSIDGKRVAAELSDDSLRIWDASNGELVATFVDPAGMDAVLSPDGNTVARLVEKPELGLRLILSDVRTHKTVCTRDVAGGQVAFSADGKKLAYSGPEPDAADPKIINLENPVAPDTVLTSPAAPQSNLLMWFGSDDSTLHLLTRDGQLKTWRTGGGDANVVPLLQATLSGIRAYFPGAAAPDGQHFAGVRAELRGTANSKGVTHLDVFVDLLSSDSANSVRQALRWNGDETSVRGVAFVDSGKTLAVVNAALGLEFWDVASLTRKKLLPFERTFFLYLSATPDGRTLAVASQDAIYMLEGDKLRKVVDLKPASLNLALLATAFVLVFAVWATMRWRRKARRKLRRGE